MTSLTIKTRLRLSFLTMAVLFTGFGVFALHQMAVINAESTVIEEKWLPSVMSINNIETAAAYLRIAEALHVMTTDTEGMTRWNAEAARWQQVIDRQRHTYESRIATTEERDLYERFGRQYADYLRVAEEAMALSRRNDNEAATRKLEASGGQFKEFSATLAVLVALNRSRVVAASNEGDQIFSRSRQAVGAAAVAMVVVALLLAWQLERTVNRPLGDLTALVRRLAQGRLESEASGRVRRDEIGAMTAAVSEISATLRSVVGDLRNQIDAIRAGELSQRVAADRHPGEFGALAAGLNELIDLLIRPLNDVSGVMQRLAAGDLEGRMGGQYEGELRALKANVNRSLETLVGFLGELGIAACRFAEGDLTRAITGSYHGAFAGVKANLNGALTQLGELITAVAENTRQVAVATTETSAAAQQVAQGSQRQLQTLLEVSAALEQAAGAIGEIAANGERGSTLAAATQTAAQAGEVALAALTEQVETVAGHHDQVDRIAVKITRIADKTHVLALNAAIEAVRASERMAVSGDPLSAGGPGRGGGSGQGLIAQQIGRLAEDTAQAAHEAERLLGDAAGSIRRSVVAAGEARGAIAHIGAAARDSGSSAQAIAAGITEQSAAVMALSEQMAALRGVGEGNASAAEEISATMEELSRMIHAIAAKTARFTHT